MKTTTKIIIISFFLTVLLFANFASANLVNCGGTKDNPDPCTIPALITAVKGIINFLLTWAWLISILFIVYAGLQMIFARGNEEEITKAKSTLTNAVIGFIIILVSFVLINLVVGILTGKGGIDPNAIFGAFQLVP